MPELLVDFITSLEGCASAEGWPGWWGLEGPEYLTWLADQPERSYTLVMGANTYRVMYGFVEANPTGSGELDAGEADAMAELTGAPKLVFSSTLAGPLPWANSELVSGDAIEAMRALKRDGPAPMRTIGSVSLCRSLLQAGLVDRFRVVVFPVITGVTGRERIYEGYPDVALDLIDSRTFDGRTQLLEYRPRLLDGPPGT